MSLNNFKYIDAFEYMKKTLKKSRFEHCLRVGKLAEELAIKHGIDSKKTRIAGLFHDICKHVEDEEVLCIFERLNIKDKFLIEHPNLSHGLVGAELLKNKFMLNDEDVYLAIKNHTFGRLNMSIMEKIVFVADSVECGRDYNGREDLEKLAFEDIDLAFYMVCKNTLKMLLDNNKKINPILVEIINENIGGKYGNFGYS